MAVNLGNLGNDTPGANKLQQGTAAGAQTGAYADSYGAAYYNSVASKLGVTPDQLTAYIQQNPSWAPGKQILDGMRKAAVSGLQPDSLADKILQKVSLGLSLVGVGAMGAPLAAAAGATGAGATIAGGAISGGVGAGLQGQNIGKGAVLGAVSGAIGNYAKPAAGAVDAATGIGSTASSAVVKGAIGAGMAGLSGGNVIAGAASGVGGSLATSGASELGASPGVSSAIGKVAGGVVGSELTSKPGSTLTSPTGHSATTTSSSEETMGSNAPPSQFEASNTGGKATGSMGLSPGVAPIVLGAGMAAASSTGGDPNLAVGNSPEASAPGSSSSFIGDVGTGVLNSLGGGNLGQTIGGMAPYLAVGAIGMEQAKAGEAQDAKYSAQQQALAQPAIKQSNDMLAQYNAGKLNSTDQKVVDTGVSQGASIIKSASGLSDIAKTAFSNYNSGKLNAADQITLDNQTAAAKQQVAQQLASAGITDSTILAAQNQSIDNQAIQTKQSMLNNYFNTGSAAYNQWLQATTQGQQTIQDAQKFASTSLQNELANSMAEANIGIGEVNTAIQTQMTTDANYAAQVSQLLGTLATAYAKQVAGRATSAGGGGASGNPIAGAAGSAAKGAASGGSGGNDPFAGTSLANNTAARGAYNQNNAPTNDEIGSITGGATSTNSFDIGDYGNGVVGQESDWMMDDINSYDFGG